MSQSLNPGQALLSLRQAGAMMNSMNPRQRWIVAGGVFAVIVAMAALLLRANQPSYTVLYSGLQPADLQQVTAQLDTLAIPYQLSSDGAGVSVPGKQLDRARLGLAAAGLPHTGQIGFSIFDKTNWSGSDFAEQVNYQRALEGELERTIETIHDVRSARVHITMAHNSLFTSEDRPAKAAVMLTLKNGSLAPGMVTAIRHLVASAVDHLPPANVAVMDANGQIALSDGQQTQNQLETELQAKIIATLAPIVGIGHVRASVNVAYDPTSADDTQETYNPAQSAVLTSQSSSSGAPAVRAASGVPGTTSNLPAVQAPGTNFKSQLGLSDAQGQQTQSQTFAVSRSVDHTVRPAGTLQRISAAVVLDNASQTTVVKGHTVTTSVPRTPAEMQQLQALAAAAIGLNPARGDVLTVSNLPFLRTPEPLAPPPPPAPVSWQQRLPLPLSWLAAAAGLLLLLLVLGGFLLLRRRAPAPAPGHLHQVGAGESLAQTQPPPREVEHEVLNMTELLEADPEDTPPEVKEVLQLKLRLAERVRREPAIAGRLIQGWINKRREEPAS